MNRFAALVVGWGLALTTVTAFAEEPPQVGQARQLFIDDLLIEDLSNVRLTLQQPTQYEGNPVLRADRPWEGDSIALAGTVLYDEEERIFKMWYRATGDSPRVCYATSPDGINWDKPVLNLKPYEGSMENNIVLGGPDSKFHPASFAVIKDRADPDPRRRYKMLTYHQRDRFACLVSPDGLQWDGPINPGEHETGNVVSMYYDGGLGQYVGLLQGRSTAQGTPRLASFSDDFVRWSKPQEVLVPDKEDPPSAQLDAHVAFMYEGLRLGYLTLLRPDAGTTDTHLCCSRAGKTWHRYRERIPFLPTGPAKSWDADRVRADAGGLIVWDGRIWLYYTGGRNDPEGHPRGHSPPAGQIGLAHLRQDGFVSADAGVEGGYLLTKPLIAGGSSLRINADARHGRIQAELLDAAGKPIPGRELTSSIPFQGDALDAPLRWDSITTDELAGRPIRIRFHLRNASLYSFRFAQTPGPHLVFLVSEDPDNYQAHRTIPPFAEMLRKEYGFRCTVIQGEGDPQAFHFPGLEVLPQADLLVIFFRRRALSSEQLGLIRSHLEAGKPLIGIRTANHAFSVRGEVAAGHEKWWEFVPEVLGCENRGYGPVAPGTNVMLAPEAERHPILRNVEPSRWHSDGNLYLVKPLTDPQATVLLTGSVEDKSEPVAWTRTCGAARVFYTSLGYPTDFEQPRFRRLLINAIHWTLEQSIP